MTRDDLRIALHRVADAAIDADDALREHGSGERLDEAIAAVGRAFERVRVAHAALRERPRNLRPRTVRRARPYNGSDTRRNNPTRTEP